MLNEIGRNWLLNLACVLGVLGLAADASARSNDAGERNGAAKVDASRSACSSPNACETATVDPDTGDCVITPIICHDDGNRCTPSYSCNPASGVCQPDGPPIVCDDGLACNGVEQCQPATGQCLPGTPIVCDDGMPCNGIEQCDSGTGACLPGTPVVCGDHNACNGAEQCDPDTGFCVSGTPITCPDDGNLCTPAYSCNLASGVCEPDGVPIVCDDGLACNGIEQCAPATGQCLSGTPVSTSDNIACTVDACAEPSGSVTNTPDNDACVADACSVALCAPAELGADATSGCVIVALDHPDDGLACTMAACDGLTGDVTHALADGWCVIDETCVAAGATPAGNPCVECAPAMSTTAWSPASDGTSCADGDECNGSESCMDGTCSAGTPVEIPDDSACAAFSCSTAGDVVETFLDGPCDDGNPCTVGDACSADGTCGGTTYTCDAPPACGFATGAACDGVGGCLYPASPDGTLCPGGWCEGGSCAAGSDPCAAPLWLSLAAPLVTPFPAREPWARLDTSTCAATAMDGPSLWLGFDVPAGDTATMTVSAATPFEVAFDADCAGACSSAYAGDAGADVVVDWTGEGRTHLVRVLDASGGFSESEVTVTVSTSPTCPGGEGCEAVCGDGIVSGDEDCDEGPDNSDLRPDACRSTCTLPSCGDGVVDVDEDCDDGGASGGCPSTCVQPTEDVGSDVDDAGYAGDANTDTQTLADSGADANPAEPAEPGAGDGERGCASGGTPRNLPIGGVLLLGLVLVSRQER